MFLPCYISVPESIRISIRQPCSKLRSTLLCIVCFCFVTVIVFFSLELLILLFAFVLVVCTINFLGKVLLVGDMRYFRKLFSNLSSTLIPEEKAESAIEKGL